MDLSTTLADLVCNEVSALVSLQLCAYVRTEDGLLQQEVARCRKGRDKKGAGDAAAKAGRTLLESMFVWNLFLLTGKGCWFLLAQAYM